MIKYNLIAHVKVPTNNPNLKYYIIEDDNSRGDGYNRSNGLFLGVMNIIEAFDVIMAKMIAEYKGMDLSEYSDWNLKEIGNIGLTFDEAVEHIKEIHDYKKDDEDRYYIHYLNGDVHEIKFFNELN